MIITFFLFVGLGVYVCVCVFRIFSLKCNETNICFSNGTLLFHFSFVIFLFFYGFFSLFYQNMMCVLVAVFCVNVCLHVYCCLGVSFKFITYKDDTVVDHDRFNHHAFSSCPWLATLL